MRKLKAGIVGCGGIANGKHLPAMKKSGLYEIVAFCDIVRERAEKAKEEYGTEDAKVFFAIGFSHITSFPASMAAIEISA